MLLPRYKFVCQPRCSVAECRNLKFKRYGLCKIHVKINKIRLIGPRIHIQAQVVIIPSTDHTKRHSPSVAMQTRGFRIIIEMVFRNCVI